MAIFLSAWGVSAKAGEAYHGGFAIGFVGNLSDFDTSGHEVEGHSSLINTATETTTTSVSNNVNYGSLMLEYHVREAGLLGLTIGVNYIPGEATLGSKSRTDSTGAAGDDENDTGTYTAKATIDNHVTFYVEPTIYAGNNFGFYVKGGISRVTVKSLEDLSLGESFSAYGDENVAGVIWGAGIRAVTPWGIFVKVGYEETDYDKVVLQSKGGNLNRITADPEQKSVRFALGYQF